MFKLLWTLWPYNNIRWLRTDHTPLKIKSSVYVNLYTTAIPWTIQIQFTGGREGGRKERREKTTCWKSGSRGRTPAGDKPIKTLSYLLIGRTAASQWQLSRPMQSSKIKRHLTKCLFMREIIWVEEQFHWDLVNQRP